MLPASPSMAVCTRLAGRQGCWLLLVCALAAASHAVVAEIVFEQRLIRLGGQTIKVEIADSPARQTKGLMGRQALGEHEGMLFVFPASGARTFWMKGTLVPLSLGAFDRNRKLLTITRLEPYGSSPAAAASLVTTPPQTRYVLEVRQGWFEKNRIGPGAVFSFLPP